MDKIDFLIDPDQLPAKLLDSEKVLIFYRLNAFNFLRYSYYTDFLPKLYYKYQDAAILTYDHIHPMGRYEQENIDLIHSKFIKKIGAYLKLFE